jgi:hypothetical protein
MARSKGRFPMSKRLPIAFLLGLLAALVVSRGRTVVSAAPRRSKAAMQELTTDVRTMFGKGQDTAPPTSTDAATTSSDDPPSPQGTVAAATAETTAASADNGDAATTTTTNDGDIATNIPGEQVAGASTAPTAPATIAAGEDESGTFHPTLAETDEFGVIVTDDEPAGFAAIEHSVKGDGSPSCPDEYPIKGNANSRIYHRPGEPSYEQTIPEVCFANEEEAGLAGYRPRRS